MVLLYLPLPAICNTAIQVKLDGQATNLDVKPIIVNGRILVPVRGIFSQMRAFIQWQPENQEVLIARNSIVVKLTVNSDTAFVNDHTVTLDSPAVIVNGRLMVPLRFISESFKADVKWDAQDNTVLIDDTGTADINTELEYANASATALDCLNNNQFKIAWRYSELSPSNLVADDSGNVYFIDQYSTLRAVDANGNALWSANYGGEGVAYLARGLDGTIYVVSEGFPPLSNLPDHVFVFDKNGTAKWSSEIDNPIGMLDNQMFAADQDGNFFIATQDGICAYDNKGAVKWINKDVVKTSTSSPIAISNVNGIWTDPAGNIYVRTNDITNPENNSDAGNQLVSLDPKGSIRWTKQGVPTEANLYFNNENQLYYWNISGLHVIDAATGGTATVGSPAGYPARESWAGYAYIQNKPNGIVAVDSNGQARWTYSVPDGLNGQMQDIVADAAGNVYFADDGGNIYSLDQNGKERYIFLRNNDMISSTALSVYNNNQLFCLTSGLGLFTINQS
ncbi:MAG: stalk domain-containing protein [Thermacetogeniaceae bacterium]